MSEEKKERSNAVIGGGIAAVIIGALGLSTCSKNGSSILPFTNNQGTSTESAVTETAPAEEQTGIEIVVNYTDVLYNGTALDYGSDPAKLSDVLEQSIGEVKDGTSVVLDFSNGDLKTCEAVEEYFKSLGISYTVKE